MIREGLFLVKSLYTALSEDSLSAARCISSLRKQFGGQNLTLDQLQRRVLLFLIDVTFAMLESEEIMDHLLFHCEKRRPLWEGYFSLFWCDIMRWLKVQFWESLLSWESRDDFWVGKWQAGPSCLFWSI